MEILPQALKVVFDNVYMCHMTDWCHRQVWWCYHPSLQNFLSMFSNAPEQDEQIGDGVWYSSSYSLHPCLNVMVKKRVPGTLDGDSPRSPSTMIYNSVLMRKFSQVSLLPVEISCPEKNPNDKMHALEWYGITGEEYHKWLHWLSVWQTEHQIWLEVSQRGY